MRPGLDQNEVLSLAKTMEVKFTVSVRLLVGPNRINFDPNDPRKRCFRTVVYRCPLLKAYYGTGGDMNVDETHEVIPITESSGVWHPREGVLMDTSVRQRPIKSIVSVS